MEQKQKLEIGERIKWLRDNSAETSRTISRAVDVSDEAVRNWIAGRGIAWDNAEKVAKLFGLDVDWIWRGEGTPPDGYPEEERPATPDPFADPYAEQLDRIEEKLDEILERLKEPPEEHDADGVPDRLPPDPDPDSDSEAAA